MNYLYLDKTYCQNGLLIISNLIELDIIIRDRLWGGALMDQALRGIPWSGGEALANVDWGDRLNRLESQVQQVLTFLGPMQRRSSHSQDNRGPVSFDGGRARIVRDRIRHRRQREQFFAADLFADPAWDMLLDLYAAHYEGRGVSVTSLCIAAAVPPTTALRWIKALTDLGLFERSNDPRDGRRVYVNIGEDTRLRMDRYFDQLAQ